VADGADSGGAVSNSAMLEVSHLTKRYSGVTVVNDVSFVVRAGDIVGYLGPNGSGKTTTAKIITGLLDSSSGTVRFDGGDIHDDLVGYRRRLGYVPEEPHLYPFLTGREYLELVGRLRELEPASLSAKITALVELFGLGSAADRNIASYSKGMKQKVLIIAALVHDPDLVILDEPDSGLDVTAAIVLRHLIRGLAAQGKAVLYSSHVMDSVEKLCSRVLVLHKGRVVADDSVERLRGLRAGGSLEDVFSELVMREDPEQVAQAIIGVLADHA